MQTGHSFSSTCSSCWCCGTYASRSDIKTKPFHLLVPLRFPKTLESAYDFLRFYEGKRILIFQFIFDPHKPENLWPLAVKFEWPWRTLQDLYAVVYFLQQTLPLSAGVNSSHDRAIVSHATTVGDSFLGAGGGGVVWESYLLKSTFVVVDLEIRLMRFNCTYEISLSCLLIRMWDNVISVSCERRCNYTTVQVV